MKKSKLILHLICISLAFLIVKSVQAQNTQSAPSNLSPIQVPGGRIAGPLILNSGIVKPLENLDVFEHSSLGSKGSTLGEKVGRRSNIEINKSRENKATNLQQEGEEYVQEEAQLQMEEPRYSFVPFPPASETQIYRWTDKGGVIHITNNIDSVPPEYRDEATKSGGE